MNGSRAQAGGKASPLACFKASTFGAEATFHLSFRLLAECADGSVLPLGSARDCGAGARAIATFPQDARWIQICHSTSVQE